MPLSLDELDDEGTLLTESLLELLDVLAGDSLLLDDDVKLLVWLDDPQQHGASIGNVKVTSAISSLLVLVRHRTSQSQQ